MADTLKYIQYRRNLKHHFHLEKAEMKVQTYSTETTTSHVSTNVAERPIVLQYRNFVWLKIKTKTTTVYDQGIL